MTLIQGFTQSEIEKAIILRGYGGDAVQPREMCTVKINLDLAKATVKALIVPDSVQSVGVIVEQPFMDRANVIVVQQGGELRLFSAEIMTLLEIEQLPSRKVTLWAAEATVIPPNESANVLIITNDFSFLS